MWTALKKFMACALLAALILPSGTVNAQYNPPPQFPPTRPTAPQPPPSLPKDQEKETDATAGTAAAIILGAVLLIVGLIALADRGNENKARYHFLENEARAYRARMQEALEQDRGSE